jgi:hypothetical protein
MMILQQIHQLQGIRHFTVLSDAIHARIRDLLQLPLFSELSAQDAEIIDNISARDHNCLLGRPFTVGRHSEIEVCEERMWYYVSGEDDLWVFVKTLRNEVAECVILLVEGEDCGIWYAFRIVSSVKSWCRKENTYEYQVSM